MTAPAPAALSPINDGPNEKGPRLREGLPICQRGKSQSPVDTSMVLPSSRVT